ncbi:DUF6350 family protein [Streptomyces sp. NPDC059398]|uniref:cell division protein PerM n=1 Tax=Streptomyces sp. NPDC059398 TaxID=3346820 RepID=UPI00367750CE
MTERSPSLAPVRSRSAVLADCVLRGGLAAALGLGSLTVLVMLLWISSPYPDSGPGGALHVTAALWLLAHGTELTRHDTTSGVPAPLGLVPMLLVILPVWLVQRAARAAFDPANGRPGPSVHGALAAVTSGYLLVAALVTWYASDGPLSVRPLSALWHLPLVAGVAAGVGVWRARAFPREPFSGWGRAPYAGGGALPAGVRRALRDPRVPTALRAGVAAVAVLAGGGALLVGGSLVWHGGAAQESFLRLTGAWSGRFTVLLLAAALVPNAALWGASYALGPGFTLGTGSVVTPLVVTGNAALPYFPLLAALPGPGSGTPLTWAVAGVPVAAGAVLGWFVTRVRDDGRAGTFGGTALMALSAAVVCAAVMAGLAALSGGPLGTGRLTSFGPVWWHTSVATLAWTVGTGLPVALLRRWWALRSSRAGAAAGSGAAGVEAPADREATADGVAAVRVGVQAPAEVQARMGVAPAEAPASAKAMAPGPVGDPAPVEPEAHEGGGMGASGEAEGKGDVPAGDSSGDSNGGSDDGARAGRWAALRALSGRLFAKFPLTDAQDTFPSSTSTSTSTPTSTSTSSSAGSPGFSEPPAASPLPSGDAGAVKQPRRSEQLQRSEEAENADEGGADAPESPEAVSPAGLPAQSDGAEGEPSRGDGPGHDGHDAGSSTGTGPDIGPPVPRTDED